MRTLCQDPTGSECAAVVFQARAAHLNQMKHTRGKLTCRVSLCITGHITGSLQALRQHFSPRRSARLVLGVAGVRRSKTHGLPSSFLLASTYGYRKAIRGNSSSTLVQLRYQQLTRRPRYTIEGKSAESGISISINNKISRGS
jgi:hypothetical protein